MGLRWGGINFESLVIEIREGYARSQVTKLKSECSRDELPLDPGVATILLEWKRLCPATEGDWFSPARAQRNPTILARCGRRCSMPRRYEPRFRDGSAGIRFVTAIVLGSTKRVLLSVYSRKLMRHANISTTMNVYGGAFMESKRKAKHFAVQRVLVQDHTK